MLGTAPVLLCGMKFLYLLLATATADRTPPRIAVDLSLPPQNRWDAVFTAERNASLWEALGLIDSISPLFKTLLGIAAKDPDPRFARLDAGRPGRRAEGDGATHESAHRPTRRIECNL